MLPMIIATQNGYPAVRLLPTPTTVKRAKPMVSKIKNVMSRRTSRFSKAMTHTNAKAVQMRYMGFSIHAGVTSSNRSRIVPPPMAVTNPTT